MSLAAVRRRLRRFPPPEPPPEGHVWMRVRVGSREWKGWVRQEYRQSNAMLKMGVPVPPEVARVAVAEQQRIAGLMLGAHSQ